MRAFKIIKEKIDWVNVLKSIDNYDFYHTYDYHHLSKNENEEPILFHYVEGSIIIAIPFLLRKVFDTEFYDLTSVYGYAGPLTKSVDQGFNNSRFLEQFNTFLVEHKIVCIFSRLHPYLHDQSICLLYTSDAADD